MNEKRGQLTVIGSFFDQPSRILSYATAASSLGSKARFLGTLPDDSDQNTASYLFTDETAMCEAADILMQSEASHDLAFRLQRVMLLSDKFKLREAIETIFPHDHFLVRSVEDLEHIPLGCGIWIAKPRWGSNSRDVRRSKGAKALQMAIEPIVSRNNQALIEKYIEGKHFCVDFLWSGETLEVLGVCAKHMASYETQIAESFHTLDTWPEEKSALILKRLQPFFRDFLEGVPLTVHGEFVLSDSSGEVHVAELNPRAPWGMLPELFSLGHGINFDELVIANALGKFSPVSRTRNPVVLGAIHSETFFDEHETLQDYGNTLFVERFDSPQGDNRNPRTLTKHGRYLLWGREQEAVQREWNELAVLARPEWANEITTVDTAETWKSKCC